MILAVVFVLVGLVVLARAADEFVAGAARIALRLDISPVVVGAVIVGFGTSAPELLVSGLAAVEGDSDLGVGNIIGSNVANLSLVLGVAALIAPIVVSLGTLRREGLLAAAASALFVLFVQSGLGRVEGVILLCVLVVALSFIVITTMRAGGPVEIDVVDEGVAEISLAREVVRTVVGITFTVIAAQLLVAGAVAIAEEVGLGTGFVGLTLVAVGTSLPELVTGVAAARRGETDLLVGNLLGSNIFNSLAVGGVVALIGPGPLTDDKLAGVASIVMLGVTVVGLVFMLTERTVVRWEALVLLAVYLGTLPLLVSEEEPEDPDDGVVVAAVVGSERSVADPVGNVIPSPTVER